MITASVSIALDRARPDLRRRTLGCLVEVPDGARVVIRVGSVMPEPSLTWLLAEHEPRLLLEIEGDLPAVREWVADVRAHVGEVRR